MPLPKLRSHAIACTGALLMLACARTQRVALDPEPRFEPRDLVEVWRADSVMRLHAVRIQQDTLSGVHYLSPTTCDTCRVSVPLVAVDSLRAGSTGEKTVLLVLAGAAVWLAIFAITFQSGSGT